MKTLAKLFLVTIFISSTAFANDSAGTTAAGGIQFIKTPTVKMQTETLTISSTEVKVDYIFQNISDKDVTTTVFFPLPPYRMKGADISWDDEIAKNKNAPFKNFSVIVNGKAVDYQVRTQAMLDDEDVTSILNQAGIPLNPQLAAGQVPMDPQEYAKAKQWRAKAKQLDLTDRRGNPLWQKQVTYYWQQTFPAKQPLTISHIYKPAAGQFYAAVIPQQENAQAQSVKDAIQRIPLLFKLKLDDLENGGIMHAWLMQQSKQPKSNGVYALIYNVNYILKTGANWAGPIQQFNLVLQHPEGGVVAYNDFYGNKPILVTKQPDSMEITIENFTPKKDLQILFGAQAN